MFARDGNGKVAVAWMAEVTTAVVVACNPLSVRATVVAVTLALATTREPEATPAEFVPAGVASVAAELELAPTTSLFDSALAAEEAGAGHEVEVQVAQPDVLRGPPAELVDSADASAARMRWPHTARGATSAQRPKGTTGRDR